MIDRPHEDRTAQDLLAERRANVLERERETCPTARAMLEYHIGEIDDELRRRDPRGSASEVLS